MKNKFFRPNEVKFQDFDSIIEQMKNDLKELAAGNVNEADIMEYVTKAVSDAKLLERNQEMAFWGLDEPENMPSDARAAYFYSPTYIMVSMLAWVRLYGPDKVIEIPGFEETFKKGLLASTGRGFVGSGFDFIEGLLECLEIFAIGHLFHFTTIYPDFCPEFTKQLQEVIKFLEAKLEPGEVKGEWGENHTRRAADLVKTIREQRGMKVFVYGTLLQGRNNHDAFLWNSRFLGEGVLNGYALYDLGSFPGIKRKEESIVKGEIYSVDGKTLENLNRLEGEGTLYTLICESVDMEGEIVDGVGVYVYLHEVDEQKVICSDDQPWRKSYKYGSVSTKKAESAKDDLVWYVAYGSNMLEERFLCYINGGKFRNGGRNLEKCSDMTPPKAKMLYELPFNMYYGKQSRSWDSMGVSFLDVTQKGKAYGTAYLISKEQYEHICREENGGSDPECSSWYNQRYTLGTFDEIPVVTLTNRGVVVKNLPSPRYMEVLAEGLRENYVYLCDEEINEYITSRNK